MDKRRLQRRLRGGRGRNAGPVATSGPAHLTITQCCMHRLGVKCVQANACPCWYANRPCMSGLPSENCRNQGPTQTPTAPRLATT